MTVFSFVTVSVRASSTVEPETAIALMGLVLPSVVTVKAEGSAVVEERVSL